MPLVGGPAGDLVEEIEDAKGEPDSPVPLRRVAVPGTGCDDVANNRTAGMWWIMKGMPL
jgi:hypothetical protein